VSEDSSRDMHRRRILKATSQKHQHSLCLRLMMRGLSSKVLRTSGNPAWIPVFISTRSHGQMKKNLMEASFAEPASSARKEVKQTLCQKKERPKKNQYMYVLLERSFICTNGQNNIYRLNSNQAARKIQLISLHGRSGRLQLLLASPPYLRVRRRLFSMPEV